MFFEKIGEIGKIIREVELSRIIIPDGASHKRQCDDLTELAESIREHGILEPVLVRKTDAGSDYVIISGERRAAAARISGLKSVPCICIEGDEADGAVMSIIENLHRADLDIFGEAAAISSLLRISGMTQERCARRLCVSQSYIANKLRLLRISEADRAAILEGGLTERHCRALLRIPDGPERSDALRRMIEEHMNVAAAEEYTESVVCALSRAGDIDSRSPSARRRLISGDIRAFCSSVDRAVQIIRLSGIAVDSDCRETERGTEISIILHGRAG